METLEISFNNPTKKPVLHRFRVKDGKKRRLQQWLTEIQNRAREYKELMQWERSLLEAVFTSDEEDGIYLHWLVIQKPGARSIVQSPHAIDREHIEVLNECLEIDANRNRTSLEYFWKLTAERKTPPHDHRDLR